MKTCSLGVKQLQWSCNIAESGVSISVMHNKSCI